MFEKKKVVVCCKNDIYDAIGANMYSINYNNGEINKGCHKRIKECFKKAEVGQEITVGFLGGSITQGACSSVHETCYAYLVYDWFRKTFPATKINYINAGIGGTTSQYGVARVKKHLLQYSPDFILAEFAVNDDNSDFFRETYEGLVRVILSDTNKPALLLMNNVRYDNCVSAEDMHLQVAKNYDVPMVSMKSTILPEILSGAIPNRDITHDDLHPNDAGHELVANVITSYLNKIYDEMKSEADKSLRNSKCCENGNIQASDKNTNNDINLPEAISINGFENSTMYQADNANPKLDGFVADNEKQNGILDIYKNGWMASNKGDKITFEIEGTSIAVQYRKSVNQPTPIATVIVDGVISSKKMLNGNFDEDWGDCLFIDTVANHISDGKHIVEIEIIEAHEDDKVPFYLVSVIGSNGKAGENVTVGGSNLFIG